MKFRSTIAILIMLVASAGGQPAPAEQSYPDGTRQSDSAVKAAFLFNFIKFVEWPADRFPGEGEPICVGVLGLDEMAEALSPIERRNIRNRPLRIYRNPTPAELALCQVVFISDSEQDRLAEILPVLAANAVLTVGDMDDFAARGGVIGFVIRNSRVGLEVNAGAAEASHLKISAKLMELAKVIR